MSILDDIQEHLGGHRYSDYLACICPYHSDTTPSLIVHEDSFICLACGKKGRTKELLKNGSFVIRQPEKIVYNPFKAWLDWQSLPDLLHEAWQTLNVCPSEYLKSRGIDDKTRMRLGIGKMGNFITIPITDRTGTILSAFARNLGTGTRYFVPKGHNPSWLYSPSWKRVEQANEVYLTFGCFDAISLWIADKAAISTTSGKKLDPTALDWLRKKIIVIGDDEEEKEASILANKLGWRGRAKNIHYPVGTKDINDLYKQGLLSQALL